jgi:predicted HicB family RNase H-like nuclease
MSKNKVAEHAAVVPTPNAEHYQYSVAWSDEDQAYIGRVAEFPSLAAHGASMEEALREIRTAVAGALEDMEECGEKIPEPFSKRTYSGRINVRMAEHVHRQLAVEARQQGVSLNQWINTKLGAPV